MMFSDLLGSWVPRAVIEEARRLLRGRPAYLDLGCGGGLLTVKVANIVGAAEAFGVDVDAASLAEAKRRGISTLRCDLDRSPLPFADDRFDIATAFELIEHLERPLQALREAFRVLRRGGVLVLETPNAAGCASRFVADQLKIAARMGGIGGWAEAAVREAKGFNPAGLRGMLLEAGFNPLRLYGVPHPPPGLSLPVPVEEVKGESSVAPHIVALARKP